MKRFILIVCTLFLCCLGFSQNSETALFVTGHSTEANVIVLNDKIYTSDNRVHEFTITEIVGINADTCKVSLQGFCNNTTASVFYNLYIKKGDKIQFKKTRYAKDANILISRNAYDHELYELSDFTFNEMTLKILK